MQKSLNFYHFTYLRTNNYLITNKRSIFFIFEQERGKQKKKGRAIPSPSLLIYNSGKNRFIEIDNLGKVGVE